MGLNSHTMPKFEPLDLPSIKEFASEKTCHQENIMIGITQQIGKYLCDVIRR
jgi:hypothetical protein